MINTVTVTVGGVVFLSPEGFRSTIDALTGSGTSSLCGPECLTSVMGEGEGPLFFPLVSSSLISLSRSDLAASVRAVNAGPQMTLLRESGA